MSEREKDLIYKIGKIEGTVEQINIRLNHIEKQLDKVEKGKVGKWEMRIWSIIIIAIVTIWSYIFLYSVTPIT